MRVLAALALAAAALGCGGRFGVGYDDGGVDAGDAGLAQQRSDKIDILFMIDNSASMGTKQELLRRTVPDFLDRLILPPCVSSEDPGLQAPRAGGACPAGFVDAFTPIVDIHVGVVTSSLGGGGADVCDANATISPTEDPLLTRVSRHNDDRGRLVNRLRPDRGRPPPNGVEDALSTALPSNFLAWLPPAPPNSGKPQPTVTPYADRAQLYADFEDLVGGVQEFGCGLEAQLESVYRFLVQPDPWDHVELDTSRSPAVARLVGVDSVVLQQRRDFLRPDSVVAVILVSDEEDSWSDPMWLGGRGWLTRASANGFSTTGQLPRGTAACARPVDPSDPSHTGPNDPACRWCGFPEAASDPSCAGGALYSAKEDGLNVRYTNDMLRRYGMDPQFPVDRYVTGFTSPKVPDRFGEHYGNDATFSPAYVGRKNCTNPLFAKDLPTDPNGELCNLAPGPRNASLVFFTAIVGVPWQLLTNDPKAGGVFKTTLGDEDWVRILGKDPATFQSEGIDPHMVESIAPRAGIPCTPGAPRTCDPFHGKEWDTSTSKAGVDLEYACTFPLPAPIDCTKLPDGATCDCGGSYAGPLCEPNPNDGNQPTLQTRGKAYPGIRELRVARGLGARGVVGSICARTVDFEDADYGHRPALRALAQRMSAALSR